MKQFEERGSERGDVHLSDQKPLISHRKRVRWDGRWHFEAMSFSVKKSVIFFLCFYCEWFSRDWWWKSINIVRQEQWWTELPSNGSTVELHQSLILSSLCTNYLHPYLMISSSEKLEIFNSLRARVSSIWLMNQSHVMRLDQKLNSKRISSPFNFNSSTSMTKKEEIDDAEKEMSEDRRAESAIIVENKSSSIHLESVFLTNHRVKNEDRPGDLHYRWHSAQIAWISTFLSTFSLEWINVQYLKQDEKTNVKRKSSVESA